ncbi:MAG TPA: methylated-DNA--[protein]-cysteine S-methyltransferase [Terracidiphilus sp.]|nr:methylated-DNA--[protein]-cysteine S-methyltransferase [Terracidiphilus sp.]
MPDLLHPDLLPLTFDQLSTPIGPLMLVADQAGNLRAALFGDTEDIVLRQLRKDYGPRGFNLAPARNPHGLTASVARYFAGELHAIDHLPVATAGTPFQRQVWKALRNIPCGSTTSYGKLAATIGRPAAVRAVGLANGSNPIAVIVPCHRVIGSDGSLTGYGGGIERKRWLLNHEQTPTLF